MLTQARYRAGALTPLAGTALCLAMLTGTAAAQGADQTRDDTPSRVLQGPQVRDRDLPGSGFAAGRDRSIAHPAFMDALHSLTRDDVPDELRASPQQVEEIKAIDADFRRSRRASMAEHADEIRELMNRIRADGAPAERGRRAELAQRPGRRGPSGRAPGAGRADRPPGPGPRIDPGALDGEQRAALEKLREIRAGGARLDDCHARMWGVLSPEQQAYVKGRLAEIKERAPDGRRAGPGPGPGRDAERGPHGRGAWGPGAEDDRPARRSCTDRPAGAPGGRAGAGRPGPGGPPRGEFGAQRGGPSQAGPGSRLAAPPDAPSMDRLAGRLEALPPDVRARVLERIEAMLDRMESRFGQGAGVAE